MTHRYEASISHVFSITFPAVSNPTGKQPISESAPAPPAAHSVLPPSQTCSWAGHQRGENEEAATSKTDALMRNDAHNATSVSTDVYRHANSRDRHSRLTLFYSTSAYWRKGLWVMATAPVNPTVTDSAPPGNLGYNTPESVPARSVGDTTRGQAVT